MMEPSNLHFRIENDRLKGLLSEKDVEINQLKARLTQYEKIDANTEDSGKPDGFATLPLLVLAKIFDNVEPYDIETLCNCRVVCKTWKSVIDERLTFDILDPQTFLESSLVGKVKSIRFTVPLKCSMEILRKFFCKIGCSVRKVNLAFIDNECSNEWEDLWKFVRAKLMFSLVMELCADLEEFTISTRIRHFIRQLTESEMKLIGSKIKRLSLVIRNLTVSEIPALREFLFSLEGLCYLKISSIEYSRTVFDNSDSDLDARRSLIDIICELMAKPNRSLQEIDIANAFLCNRALDDPKLVLTTGKCGVLLKYSDMDLNTLLEYRDGNELVVNEQSCRNIKEGLIWLPSSTTTRHPGLTRPHRIAYCVNLELLDATLERAARSGEFAFISRLKKLKSLTLSGDCFGNRGNTKESLIPYPSLVFGCEILSLQKLRLEECVLGSDYSWLDSHFPNLTKLQVSSCVYLPQNVIRDLSKLRNLEKLKLHVNEGLTDMMLTDLCEVHQEGTMMKHVPAIAAFKKLRQLELISCNQLTDSCLVNGVLFNQTLEIVKLHYKEGQFTMAGFDTVSAMTKLKYEKVEPYNGFVYELDAKYVLFKLY